VTAQNKRLDGTKRATVATRAPSQPATFQPISVTMRMPGPGAARVMAKRSTNSRRVSQ
jgi:hypothetical protein